MFTRSPGISTVEWAIFMFYIPKYWVTGSACVTDISVCLTNEKIFFLEAASRQQTLRLNIGMQNI